MCINLLPVVSRKTKERILGLLIVICVFTLALMPQIPKIIPYEDKIGHTGLYFLLMVYFSRKFTVYIAVGLLLFIGIMLELLQHQVGYRSAEVMDVVANTLGMFLGYIYLKLRGPVNVCT